MLTFVSTGFSVFGVSTGIVTAGVGMISSSFFISFIMGSLGVGIFIFFSIVVLFSTIATFSTCSSVEKNKL